MLRIIDIALKDLIQLKRDGKVPLFLLAMPILFTLLFGLAFGGFSQGEEDTRLPVGYIDQDDGQVSAELQKMLAASGIFRLIEDSSQDQAGYEKQVADQDLAALVRVPAGYTQAALEGSPMQLALVVDTATPAGMTVEGEVLAVVKRLQDAIRTAQIASQAVAGLSFDQALEEALSGWENPPVQIKQTSSMAIDQAQGSVSVLTHMSPGMMLQSAIAGLLTAAQIMVEERKTRSLQRLLTTAVSRLQILLGHFLAIFSMIFMQFVILIVFGQFLLKVAYLRVPLATLVVAIASALCIAGLGVLIGSLAKSDEQAIIFSLIPMFLLAGLGGAWTPLEITSPEFQRIGHLSPVAWAMDGFKNITARGLEFDSVLLPSAALLGYAALFFLLAVWRLTAAEER